MQSIQLLHLLAAGAIGYLFGSIPFGLIITRLAGQGDVRKIGSGNIGATNVLRTGSKPLAAATLAGDLLKGTAAVFAGHVLAGGDGALIAGLLSFLGHLFPVWLKFRGGKGVATYIGVLLGLTWPLAALFCATWLLVALLSRYSSLSALVGSLAATLYAAISGNSHVAAIIAIMTIFIFLRHRANITRMLNGEETRIGR